MNISHQYWFIGASYCQEGNQTLRFLSEGIWENGYDDQYLDLVRLMRPSDHIAIKSAYIRKHHLPFDNHGKNVSIMAIKAIGKIIENLNDGKQVKISWTKIEPVREWYFYTYRKMIWCLEADDWKNDALIAFETGLIGVTVLEQSLKNRKSLLGQIFTKQ